MSLFRWLVDEEFISDSHNPLRKMRIKNLKPKTKTGFFTRDEFQKLVESAYPDFGLVCEVAAHTGYRKGELESLRVYHVKKRNGGYWIDLEGEYCKSGKSASQLIPEWLFTKLKNVSKGCPVDSSLLNVATHTNRTIDYVMKRAGLEKYPEPGLRRTFHSLRDSYTTWLAEDGNDPKTIQMLARHSDMRITADRYMHTDDEKKQNAIRKMTQKSTKAYTTYAQLEQDQPKIADLIQIMLLEWWRRGESHYYDLLNHNVSCGFKMSVFSAEIDNEHFISFHGNSSLFI